MRDRGEVIVCGCSEDDVAVLRSASEPNGPELHEETSLVKMTHRVMSGRPLALVLGVSPDMPADLDVIPVIRSLRTDLPVIVVAAGDSLELERTARQRGVFYYFVHPVERDEARAVLQVVSRAHRS